MKDITVIIPLHEFNGEVGPLFKKAIDSVPSEVQVIIVGPKSVNESIKVLDCVTSHKVNFVMNDDTDFVNQVNKAVKSVKTTYFTVLEFDDFFTTHYFENAEKYTNYLPDVFGFLTLTEAVDFQNSEAGPIGYMNEVFWASSFSEELGYLDEESVKDYLGLNYTGAIFKKDIFEEVGGLKPSIKITFWHEFILRAIHKGNKVYVIPKAGYVHYVNRPNSLTDIYSKTISKDEGDWWLALAQQEYYYKTDRKKEYTK